MDHSRLFSHALAPLRPAGLVVAGLLAGILGLSACSSPGGAGCTKDTDCASGRVCGSDGRCEDRSSGGASPGAPGTGGAIADDGGASAVEAGFSGADAAPPSTDISGIWRLCGAAGYYVEPHGEVIVITAGQGQASAYELGADGGSVVHQGAAPDGGDTSTLLSGPYDPSTRVWTPQFYWSSTVAYSARLTFSADGTSFTGTLTAYGPDPITWWGGREDGSFVCSK